MYSPGGLLGCTRALLIVAAATTTSFAAPRSDLAVLRIRVPAHVKLTDSRAQASAHASVRVENRGAAPVVVPDAITLAELVRLNATSLEGPISCAPPGITAAVARVSFPLTIRPARGRTVRYAPDIQVRASPAGRDAWRVRAGIGPRG